MTQVQLNRLKGERMSEIDSGGPAFPGSYTGQNGEIRWSDGMSKREWYAGMALQGMLTNSAVPPEEVLALWAYKISDAMIRAGKGEK